MKQNIALIQIKHCANTYSTDIHVNIHFVTIRLKIVYYSKNYALYPFVFTEASITSAKFVKNPHKKTLYKRNKLCHRFKLYSVVLCSSV